MRRIDDVPDFVMHRVRRLQHAGQQVPRLMLHHPDDRIRACYVEVEHVLQEAPRMPRAVAFKFVQRPALTVALEFFFQFRRIGVGRLFVRHQKTADGKSVDAAAVDT